MSYSVEKQGVKIVYSDYIITTATLEPIIVFISSFLFLEVRNFWTWRVNNKLAAKSTKAFSLVRQILICL